MTRTRTVRIGSTSRGEPRGHQPGGSARPGWMRAGRGTAAGLSGSVRLAWPGRWREGEVQARPFCPCPRSGSLGWCRGGIGSPGAVEAFGGLTSGGCLGGVVLGFAEVGDGFDEPGKAGHERELGHDGIAAGDRGTGHETGGAAQVVPGRGWTRNASIGHAGGAVVGVGGLADHPVAQELGRDVGGVGGGPGGVGASARSRLSRPMPGPPR